MPTLQEKAMLVELHISVWSARKHDKKVTREVADAHNTSDKAGRYHKRLLPQDAPSYQALVSTAGAARTAHYKHTLPWSDEGARILPAANWFEYTQAMSDARNTFNNALRTFLGEYEALRDQARIELNGLYKDEDYPSLRRLERKFAFETRVRPMPAAQDFRVALQEADMVAIQEDIERTVNDTMDAAMQDLWRRLHRPVAAMVERLSDPEAIFRDSLIGNIEEIVRLLPRLNVTGDPALMRMEQEVRDRLCGADPNEMRRDKAQRTKLAAEAQRIVDQMAAFMGPAQEVDE